MSATSMSAKVAPRQASVLSYIQEHPGATLGEAFHGLRTRENGVTYESVRSAVLKLVGRNHLRREGAGALYHSKLFATETTQHVA